MKRQDLKNFIVENGLLSTIPAFASGIYAITVDDRIVYIGESKNLAQRCSDHIYKIENAMLINEKKYLLLLAAKLGGHRVDCKLLEVCNEEERFTRERYYLTEYKPILNINIPDERRHNLDYLQVESLLSNGYYHYHPTFGWCHPNPELTENSDKTA